MVQIDATLKEIISLKQSDSITIEKFSEYLKLFSKEDFIEYLVSEEVNDGLDDIDEDDDESGF